MERRATLVAPSSALTALGAACVVLGGPVGHAVLALSIPVGILLSHLRH